ncbi:MAG TPA: adenylate/guanylate cyclase domain-containing protein [Stellaceae bacterium]|nr:adenylate/guanylate cyclase domain-containing protein [Stellaceae bacterium]
MQCGQCKARNREARRFCAQCGAALPVACPGCGFVNEPGASFCGGCGKTIEAPGPADLAAERPAVQPPERRHLTVMFCDLADSTALSMRLDPEEMVGVLRAYHTCCAEAVDRFGGSIAKYMGDGIVIYFGYPFAHEDDAERAVLAALAVVKNVARLRPHHSDLRLQVRIGISTGLVVVGELMGQGVSQEQSVVGETPNLAARLQSIAEPNAIVISASTHRLIGGLFQCRPLGLLNLKGFAEQVTAWQVEGEGRAESRFEALRAESMIPVVGRGHEIGMLLERWQQAKAGVGQAVLIAGEPGIGKSRLTSALRERLSAEKHIRLSWYCSPHHQTSALYPIIAQLERAAGITLDDSGAEKLAKLDAVLRPETSRIAEMTPLMAAMLSIPTGGRYAPLTLTASQLKEKTLEALLLRLEDLAAAQPVLCIFEDAHWVDPTTLELAARTIARIKALPVLFIMTFRPEFNAAGLARHEHVTELTLNRLSPPQAARMIEHRAGGKNIPAEVMDEIVAKADGVPLFLEELTKTVLESGLLTEEADRYTLRGVLPPLAVPATLHDSLMARLDRMSAVKQVAQLAATLGRIFTRDQLAAVSPLSPQLLDEALEQLVGAEVIHLQEHPSKVTFEFKHALLRDVAYQSLLKVTRLLYHDRIARALESKFPELAEVQPELLAYHFTEAGQIPEAIDYWQRAGKRAAQRSSNLEAIAQLTRALSLLDGIVDAEERARREYELRLSLLTPVITAKGYGSSDLEETFNRALRLSEEIGDTGEIFPVLYSRHSFEMVTGQVRKGYQRGIEAQRLAERYPQSDTAAFVGRLMGSPLLLGGDPAGALPLLERALENYDTERDHDSAHRYGQDHFVVCAHYLSLTSWHLGEVERAIEIQGRGLACARSLEHLNTLCFALGVGGFLEGLRRESAAMRDFAAEILQLGREHPIPVWTGAATIVMGHALAEQGDAEEGIAMMEAGIAGLHAIHIKIFSAMFLAWLASGHARLGDWEGGLRAIERGRVVAEGGEHWMDAEFHRLEGELRLLSSPAANDAAEECFLAALRVAREQKSRALELRAALSLARFWDRVGARQKGWKLIRDVLGGFSPAAETADLAEARALQSRLA